MKKLHLIFLGLLAFLLYFQTLTFNFVKADESWLIENNQIIQKVSLENIKKIFFLYPNRNPLGNEYNPIRDFAFMVSYNLFGGRPFGFHLVNLILYILTAASTYFVLNAIFGKPTFSLFATALFISHPIQVETVAWVITSGNLLSALFMFLSILFYIKSRGKFDRLYALSLLTYLFSILSKYYGIVTPLLIALYDYQKNSFRLRRYLPYLTIIAILIYPIIRVAQFSTISKTVHWTVISYLATFSGMFFAYLKNYFFPVRLYPLYENEFFTSLLDPKVLVGLVVFLFLFIFSLSNLKRRREVSFGILFLFISLLPVSQIIPLDRVGLIADRYFFIPSLGLAIIIAYIFSESLNSKKKILRLTSVFIFMAIVVTFSVLTIKQTWHWKDHETLWGYLVSINPLHPFAQNKPWYFSDEKILREKLKVFPQNPYIPFELAKIALEKDNFSEAESFLDLTLSLSPNLPGVQDMYNEIYLKKNLSRSVLSLTTEYYPIDNLPRLEELFKTLLIRNPEDVNLFNTLGIIYSLKGAFAEAEVFLLDGLKRDTKNTSLLESLIILYEKMGEKNKTKEYLSKLREINPQSFFVQNKTK